MYIYLVYRNVIFNKTVLLNVVKKNHLSGHVVSIPISERKNQATNVKLPRKEYSDHIKLAFFGKRGISIESISYTFGTICIFSKS